MGRTPKAGGWPYQAMLETHMIVGLLGNPDCLLQGELCLLTNDRLNISISLTTTNMHKQQKQEGICTVIHLTAGLWVGSCNYGLIPRGTPLLQQWRYRTYPFLRGFLLKRGIKD